MSDRCLGDPLYFSFADFVLHHAGDIIGNFDHDAPLPEVVEPSPYHAELAAAAASKLAEVEAWDEATAEREAKAAYDKALQAYKSQVVAEAARRVDLEVRLAEVRRWNLPTPDHERLKHNMIMALGIQIKVHNDSSPVSLPQRETGAEFKERELNEALLKVEHHNEAHQLEIERAKNLTKWLRVLHENLAQRAAN